MNHLILLCALLALSFAGCRKSEVSSGTSNGSINKSSNSSTSIPEGPVGTFKGSVNDLLPKQVSGFTLDRSVKIPKEDKDLSSAGATDGAQGEYVAEDKELGFLAMNFNTPESAKMGMRKFLSDFKQKIGEDSFTTQEEGEKKKGSTVVGDRIVLRGKGGFAAGEVVVWTNGSVMFLVSIRKRDDNSPLEFEKQFPY